MPTPPLSDEVLRESVKVYRETGESYSAGARALGLDRNTFRNRIRRARERGFLFSDGAQEALKSTSIAPGEAIIGWRRVQGEDGSFNSVMWRAPQPEADPQRLAEVIREALEDVTPPVHMASPAGPDDLCAVFPVADLHIGLLTDEEEVGEDWSSRKALRVFEATFAKLAHVTPGAGTAILAQIGDLTHTDDQRNVTPQSGHQLDADTRYFMILRRAVSAMKYAIDTLRAKYPRVIYRGCRGNHDLNAHHAVTLALAEYYRETDGVEIIESAGEFYVREFGVNMLLLHHGDRAKPERLVHFAAAEWPQIWGRTKHRLALSGHVHHEVKKEIGGMTFESLGTIIPRDFHAYTHAYSARRGLVSITLDRAHGEVSRARVSV
jgi:hypothetical protein